MTNAQTIVNAYKGVFEPRTSGTALMDTLAHITHATQGDRTKMRMICDYLDQLSAADMRSAEVEIHVATILSQ